MNSVLYFVFGFLISFIICLIIFGKSKKLDGLLIIENTREDQIKYILDIHITPEELSQKEYVNFKIHIINED